MSIEIKFSKSRISYKKAMKILLKRVEKLKKKEGTEFVWILEHPTTYTAGIRTDKKEIIDKKIKIIETNRGGKITLHNPGQKIVYFVLDLNKRKKDIRKLINSIEKSIIQFLENYKIKAKNDKKNIGIWVNDKKIAALGVRISRWVTMHGFSLNINPDLNYYKGIVPCGITGFGVTSMAEILGKKCPKISDIKLKTINYFTSQFSRGGN